VTVKRSLLAAFVVACGLLLSAQLARAADPGPKKFLEEIYRHYGADGDAIDFAGADGETVFSQSLVDLIRTDREQAAGEAGALDFDPICMCQDFNIKAVKVTVKPGPGDHTMASVSFTNFDQPQKIDVDLVKTPAGWRIDDLHGPDVASLKDYLKEALGK